MTHANTRRVRDPVHGLIVFSAEDPIDMLAWKLIDTPAFQRLRRIKQLGFSEFVFPGATHTRFSHSIGVFHTARQLVGIIRRESGSLNKKRATVALLGALLHDLGHGPFSHTFEEVQKSRGIKKKHEKWTSEIILSASGGVKSVLDASTFGKSLAEEIAELLQAETPIDIYHAIVSSSFDADRLDYLRRDRLMTGSGAGAIDFDWLLDNLRITSISAATDEDERKTKKVQTFCLDRKALQAAETFLLARYHLYDQVYLHKTTRGLELMLSAILRKVAELANKGDASKTNLAADHPLIRFYSKGGGTTTNYLALDDMVVWGALERMKHAKDIELKTMSSRLLHRKLYKCIDVDSLAQSSGQDNVEIETRLKAKFKKELRKSVLFDNPKLNIYGQVDADEDKVHKRLSIQLGKKTRREINQVSETVKSLISPRQMFRFYFADKGTRDAALDVALGQ